MSEITIIFAFDQGGEARRAVINPCPCGQYPCRVLPLNGGAEWFYEITRTMTDTAQRMRFRAAHADPRETRGLIQLVDMAFGVLSAQKSHLVEETVRTSDFTASPPNLLERRAP